MSLNVWPGEFVSLLGPSGCGKSTALRIIAGLSEPSRGTGDWRGEANARARPHDIGFVFQEPTLMPWATVADNVRLPLALAHAQGDAGARVHRAGHRRALSARPAFPHLGGIRKAVPARLGRARRGDRRRRAMNGEGENVRAGERSRVEDVMRIALPIAVLALGVFLWDA